MAFFRWRDCVRWSHLLVAVAMVRLVVHACPEPCTCYSEKGLAVTNCSGRSLTDVEFEINHNVEVLDLSHNNLTSVGVDTEISLKTLNKIDVSYNSIEDLKDLIGLRDVHELVLSYNRLSSKSKLAILSYAINLQTLDLSHNKILNPFPYNISTLKSLTMEHCSLQTLPENFLGDMQNLEELTLSGNRFVVFPTLSSASLTRLIVRNSAFESVQHQSFLQIPELRYLDLSFNSRLRNLTFPLENKLRMFVAKGCGFEAPFWQNLSHLHDLIVPNNNFKRIPNFSFKNNVNIYLLNFSSNALKELEPKCFYGLERMVVIDLSYNTIVRLSPSIFLNNTHLKFVNLTRNFINEMQGFMSESIKDVDMSYCEISSIHKDSFQMMKVITRINLAYNYIRAIPNGLTSSTLKVLNLRQCRISMFNNETFSGLDKLTYLDVAGNRLSSGIQYFLFPYSLDTIYLEDNPWACDCKSYDFRDLCYYVQTKKGTTLGQLTCLSPENAAGLNWLFACESEWTHNTVSEFEKFWVSALCVLVGAIIVCCVCLSVHRSYKEREREMRRNQERLQMDLAAQRLRTLSYQRAEDARNAPDPRVLQSPPSYAEALLMSRVLAADESPTENGGPKETTVPSDEDSTEDPNKPNGLIESNL